MVKNKLSILSLFIIFLVFITYRLIYFQNDEKTGFKATSWDSFGYYMYLPSIFIYDDVKELKWVPKIDSAYHFTGGHFYQAMQLETGTYTNKYLGGVSILQMPFFFIGHWIAHLTDAPDDGFSWPYQYAVLFAALFWTFIGFIFVRKILNCYFNDKVTALSLLLLGLTTNLIQYSAIDGGQSHAYIFPLYAFVIWFTIKWHEKASVKFAIALGFVGGLAVISRPTELILIFIPILWNLHSKEEAKSKWEQVFSHKLHLICAICAGFVAILPQLIYWKITTGNFIFDVGSKWYFLNPWFRVLVGPEIGWFLYTPVAILMVLGFFFMKEKPFKKSVITFCLLNIWIIIAWSDWKYGSTYSCRALSHSYPVFTLALASLVSNMFERGKQKFMYLISFLLILLNLYQLWIYNNHITTNFSPFLKFGF